MVGLLELHEFTMIYHTITQSLILVQRSGRHRGGRHPRGGLARQADGVGGGAGGERFRKQRFAGHFFKRSLSTGTEHWLFQTESFTTQTQQQFVWFILIHSHTAMGRYQRYTNHQFAKSRLSIQLVAFGRHWCCSYVVSSKQTCLSLNMIETQVAELLSSWLLQTCCYFP